MSEESTSAGEFTQEMVECALCGEKIPRSHSILRASVGRICHFCHTDEQIGLEGDVEWDDDWDDDEGWDDDDW